MRIVAAFGIVLDFDFLAEFVNAVAVVEPIALTFLVESVFIAKGKARTLMWVMEMQLGLGLG